MASQREFYEQLLLDLHREMKEGRGEAERANDLREDAAALWHDLTAAERTLFDELSHDLYLVEDKRRVLPLSEPETAESIRRGMRAAWTSHRYRDALGFARKLTDTSATIAYAIGRCWDNLGFHLGAVCFFDHAYAIEPKPVYAVSALESLSRASMKQAVVRAKEIAERPIVEGTLLLEAASVLHRGVLLVPPEARTAVYEEVVRITEAAWTDTTALPSIRATGLIAAGYSYEHLGRDADARLQFERAATIYPSEPALLAYGLSVLALDRRKALDHITRAAREGTRFDWPYVFATSHALELGRFAEAEHFAEAGIARTENDEVLGRLYEWSAIAAARLGRQTPIVIERFDRALAALPLDPTIQKNAAAFIEFATNQDWLVVAPPAPPSWEEMEKAAA